MGPDIWIFHLFPETHTDPLRDHNVELLLLSHRRSGGKTGRVLWVSSPSGPVQPCGRLWSGSAWRSDSPRLPAWHHGSCSASLLWCALWWRATERQRLEVIRLNVAWCRIFSTYLAVQTHPASIQDTFTESGRSTQVVPACGGVDQLQTLISHRPVHAEARRLAWLTSLRVVYSYRPGRRNITWSFFSHPWKHDGRRVLTAEQWSVQAEGPRQGFYASNPLVHGSRQVVSVVQAAQDDAGEVEGLSEAAEQRALETKHVPPEHSRCWRTSDTIWSIKPTHVRL